jgi:hypothetical protein
MHLFAGSVGVANSMQYLVLLSGLASVHHGTPRRNYSFSLARMWLAKMEPAQNDTQNDTQTIRKPFQKKTEWPAGHKTDQKGGGCCW